MELDSKKLIAYLIVSLIIFFPISSSYVFASNSVDFDYDANGNLVQDNNNYYEYDSLNQLVEVREGNSNGRILEEYDYDSYGQRVKKVTYNQDGSNTTTYYIDENFVRVVNNSGTYDFEYYYHNSQLVASEDSDGDKHFYHPDHLGSTNIVTDENGNVVEETHYLPFGEVIDGGSSRFTFTGQEDDKATALMYYGARYYSPFLRKFTQPDTVIQDVYDPQSLNRYSYVRNNPVKYTDPSGHVINLAAAGCGALMGGIVGAGVSIYNQLTSNGDVNWGYVGRDAAIGAGVGALAGLTFGASIMAPITSFMAVQTSNLIGVVGPENAMGGIGAAVSAGSKVISNAAQDKPLDDGVGRAAELGYVGGLIGGAAGGAASYFEQPRTSGSSSTNERLPDWGSMKGEVDVIKPWTGENRYWGGTKPGGEGFSSRYGRWTSQIQTNNPVYAKNLLDIPGGPPGMRTDVTYLPGAKLRIGTNYGDKAFQVEYISGPRMISPNNYVLDDYSKFIK